MDLSATNSVPAARGTLYEFLALAFREPDAAWNKAIQEEELSNRVQEACRALGRGENDLASAAHRVRQSLATLSQEEASEQLRCLFGHTVASDSPPYETEYQKTNIFQQTQTLGDITGFYRAFGLELSGRFRERQDHISIECEFMQYLAYREAYAAEHHGSDELSILRDAQKKFMQDHLGQWAPAFASLVARRADGFYRVVAELMLTFLAREAHHLGFQAGRPRLPPRPGQPSEPSCFSCPLSEDVEAG